MTDYSKFEFWLDIDSMRVECMVPGCPTYETIGSLTLAELIVWADLHWTEAHS